MYFERVVDHLKGLKQGKYLLGCKNLHQNISKSKKLELVTHKVKRFLIHTKISCLVNSIKMYLMSKHFVCHGSLIEADKQTAKDTPFTHSFEKLISCIRRPLLHNSSLSVTCNLLNDECFKITRRRKNLFYEYINLMWPSYHKHATKE